MVDEEFLLGDVFFLEKVRDLEVAAPDLRVVGHLRIVKISAEHDTRLELVVGQRVSLTGIQGNDFLITCLVLYYLEHVGAIGFIVNDEWISHEKGFFNFILLPVHSKNNEVELVLRERMLVETLIGQVVGPNFLCVRLALSENDIDEVFLPYQVIFIGHDEHLGLLFIVHFIISRGAGLQRILTWDLGSLGGATSP